MLETINSDLLQHFNCISCGGALEQLGQALACRACKRSYPIDTNGLIDMLGKDHNTNNDYWDLHWEDLAKQYQNAPPSLDAQKYHTLCPQAFLDRIVIDIGSGICRNLETYLQFGPKVIIFTDISNALRWGAQRWQQIRSQHPGTTVLFIKADIQRLPLRRHNIPIIYTCSGLFNIIPNSMNAVEHAMQFADEIFLLYNSPQKPFGRLFYQLNTWRAVMQALFRTNRLKRGAAITLGTLAIPFVRYFARKNAPHLLPMLQSDFIRVLTYDWVLSAPQVTPINDATLLAANTDKFAASIEESMGWVSRILWYKRIT